LFAAGLLLLGVAAISAACGTGQTGIAKGGDVSQGKKLFVAKCGSCHTLADAGTKGTIGPNLDGAFAGARAQHFKASTIKQGLYGSKVQLSTGQTVTAGDAYLLESILDPDKQIVKGFPKGVMSATIPPGSVSMANAKALVAFIKSKR